MKVNYGSLFALFALPLVAHLSDAFSTGAGGCKGGEAAVGGYHFFSDEFRVANNDSLAFGATEVSIGGRKVDAFEEFDFGTGQELEIAVEAAAFSFLGILIRLEAPDGVDTTLALDSTDAALKQADVCESPVVGFTHQDKSEKFRSTATIRFDQEVSGVKLDITCVYFNDEFASIFAYDRFNLNFVAPTAAPSLAPTVTANPTPAPSVSPSITPTVSKVPSVAPTIDAPSSSPSEKEICLACGCASCGMANPFAKVDIPRILQPLYNDETEIVCGQVSEDGLEGRLSFEQCALTKTPSFRSTCGCVTPSPTEFPTSAPTKAPSPSPTASPTTESPTMSPVAGAVTQNITICFSADTTLNVEGQGPVSMKDLSVGDMVEVMPGKYEPIYSFYKKELEGRYEFVEFSARGLDAPLKMSENHLLFVRDAQSGIQSTKMAANVVVGDQLILSGTPTEITQVQRVVGAGFVAPYTYTGTLMVNGGALVSVYATLAEGSLSEESQWKHHLAHVQHRMLCRSVWSVCASEHHDSGLSSIAELWLAIYRLMSASTVVHSLVSVGLVLLSLLELSYDYWVPTTVLVASWAVLRRRQSQASRLRS